MRWVLCVVLMACGTPAPPAPGPPRVAPVAHDAAVPVDAAVVESAPIDALECKYTTCIDICCGPGEVCSHGRLGDEITPKCLRPHR